MLERKNETVNGHGTCGYGKDFLSHQTVGYVRSSIVTYGGSSDSRGVSYGVGNLMVNNTPWV